MEDRCIFLLQEIACAYIDDFMLLPIQPAYQNVVEGLPEAVQRHDDFFVFTH